MAQSTDDPDGKRPRPDPGYDVLPDEEEADRYGPEVRRRLRREGRRSGPDRDYEVVPDDEPHDAEYRRRKWGEDFGDGPKRRKRRKRHPFPWIVNLLGVVCAVSIVVTIALALVSSVAAVLAPSRAMIAFMGIFWGLTAFFVRIAWGVWKRRASGELLVRSGVLSLLMGALMLAISGSWTLGAWERGELFKNRPYLMEGIFVSAVWLLGVGSLALLTREELRRWARRRSDGVE
jgi:hypothetical protein